MILRRGYYTQGSPSTQCAHDLLERSRAEGGSEREATRWRGSADGHAARRWSGLPLCQRASSRGAACLYERGRVVEVEHGADWQIRIDREHVKSGRTQRENGAREVATIANLHRACQDLTIGAQPGFLAQGGAAGDEHDPPGAELHGDLAASPLGEAA